MELSRLDLITISLALMKLAQEDSPLGKENLISIGSIIGDILTEYPKAFIFEVTPEKF